MRYQKFVVTLLAVAVMAGGLSSCRRKKYENPITSDTQQPDKVLFDKAVRDIERSRFEVARLTLQTLINTYDSSEYLAKAKLAIADSWFREGGSHGLAQAEAEYKDFILFYPTMEESAEAQEKVCMIHYRQMEKPDRDPTHVIRAEDECRLLLNQFPNSKFAPRAQQLLRNIQEVRAEGEFRVGAFYHGKGSFPAAANRLQAAVDAYPLYSGADSALYQLGDSYSKMGNRFREKAGQAYSRLVRDYPLSDFAEEAKGALKQMELPVPEADPVAVARMKYELENRPKAGIMSPVTGIFSKSPDTRLAARSGQPAMEGLRPNIPASVPSPAALAGGTTDVTVSTVGDSSTLDSNPDARAKPPSEAGAAGGNGAAGGTGAAGGNGVAGGNGAAPAAAAPAQPEPLPTNHSAPPKKQKKPKEPKRKK
ncbi:MAG: outer membrane protein assembly factor BamD [Acidobacteria bacterium]|nr:outer membrane protein assembly factor BamD [Acidobacteriota bacterium]